MATWGSRFVVCAVACVALTSAARAVTEPPSMLLPNYERTLIGSQGALEGGAILVRARTAEAGWYNPAGVVRGDDADINGNATLYELASLTFETEDSSTNTTVLNTIPAFVGSSKPISDSLSWGLAIVSPSTWSLNLSSYDLVPDPDYPTAVNTINSTSSSDYASAAVGASLSYKKSDKLCLGASGFMRTTSISLKKTRFDEWRLDSTPEIWSFNSSNSVNIESTNIGLDFGLYYKANENLQTALVARVPLFSLGATGSYEDYITSYKTIPIDILSGDPVTGEWDYYNYWQRDSYEQDVEVEWRVPLRLDAGLAFGWANNTKHLELDLYYYHGSGTYEVFPAGTYEVWHEDDTNGLVEETALRPAFKTTSRSVLNWAIGYRHELTPEKRFHAGFRTSYTPVEGGPDENLFAPVDIYLFSVGMSTSTTNTFTSFGIVLGLGQTDSYELQDLASYDPIEGKLGITTIGLVMGTRFKL
jgi:hypothetical protein